MSSVWLLPKLALSAVQNRSGKKGKLHVVERFFSKLEQLMLSLILPPRKLQHSAADYTNSLARVAEAVGLVFGVVHCEFEFLASEPRICQTPTQTTRPPAARR